MGLFESAEVRTNPSRAVRAQAKHAPLGQFANLPSAYKEADKSLLSQSQYLEKLDGLKRFPGKMLETAAQMLTGLNRLNIKPDRRIELARAILGHVYAVMARHYQHYQGQNTSLPESNNRRQELMACVEIAEQAAIAYKHRFKELYSTKSGAYNRHRDTLYEDAARILELLRLEQRFRALRHQKLPSSGWQDVNRVFFAILAHDDVDTPQRLLGSIGTWVKPTKNKNEKQQAPVVSSRELYLSIQLFGLLDATSWSTRLLSVPDGYLSMMDAAVQILPDNGAPLEPGWLVTAANHNAPPAFTRDNVMSRPTIRIEYSMLYNRLVQDYEELAKMKFIDRFDPDRISRPLISLEAMERFPVLESMLFGLRPRERRLKRHNVFGQESLRIYFGYPEAYRLLSDLAAADIKKAMDNREFTDKLASHSALMSEDGKSYRTTKWSIVNFSSGGLLVQTEETGFTNPIEIGQLIAFNPNEEELRRPMLGYVTRINRPLEHQVEVAIVRLSTYAEVAIVQDEHDINLAKGKGVILFNTLDNKWALIARHEYQFFNGTPLRLIRENDQRVPARLGHVLLTKQEFVIFELSAPGLSQH